jgi:two-component system LytT family sensor kinase
LTAPSRPLDSARMRNPWTPPTRWVLGVATALSLFTTLQMYRLAVVTAKPGTPPIEVGRILALNLAYWFVPALLLPWVVWVAHRFRLDAGNRLRNIAVHAAAALTFALIRFAGMTGVRLLLGSGDIKLSSVSWWVYAQRQFLWDLDWCLMVYSAIVGASHALAYYHESQERKLKGAQLETRLIEARLKTLEAELHPHFLFNTLHAISTLVHRDPESADRMISRLSDLLRITFDRSGDATVPLKEEIDFLQKYLEIEQTRFQDRLTVHVDVDPDVLDAEVPRMILQPLVENAMKHGIAQSVDKGHVEISAGHEDDRLWMQVRDNGGGLRGSTLKKLRTGVGLSNTRARLQMLYPGRHRLDFSELNGGLAVRIDIPFHRTTGPAVGASVRAVS